MTEIYETTKPEQQTNKRLPVMWQVVDVRVETEGVIKTIKFPDVAPPEEIMTSHEEVS